MNFLAFCPIAAQILVWPLYYWNIWYPYVIPFDSLIASLLLVYYFISPKYFTRYKKHRTIFWDTKLKNTIHTILIFLFWKNYWFRMNDLYEWSRDAFFRERKNEIKFWTKIFWMRKMSVKILIFNFIFLQIVKSKYKGSLFL